jgi:DDE_Tnp_1-like zinc-ribbon
MCSKDRVKEVKGKRGALQKIDSNQGRPSKRPRQTTTGCDVCGVPLCNNEWCWGKWHAAGGEEIVEECQEIFPD